MKRPPPPPKPRARPQEVKPAPGWAPVDSFRPNSWNPNRMDDSTFEKLKRGLQRTYEKGDSPPPIAVRPDQTGVAVFEIVDGEHRWKAHKALGLEEIPYHVYYNLSDADARTHTSMLNYLKGEYEPEAYALMLSEISQDSEWTLDMMADFLPESAETILTLTETFGLEVGFDTDDLLADFPDDSDGLLPEGSGEDEDPDPFIRFEVYIPSSVGAVASKEMERVKDFLREEGETNSLDAKAFEIILCNSRNTPLGQFKGSPVRSDPAGKHARKAPLLFGEE